MVGDNALLLEITGPGNPDSYGDVDTPGGALWTGRVPAYLRRVRRRADGRALGARAESGGQLDLIDQDVLFVRRVTGAPVLELAGDQASATTILVEDQRTPTPVRRRFRVVAIENRAGGSVADSIRLELDDDRTE